MGILDKLFGEKERREEIKGKKNEEEDGTLWEMLYELLDYITGGYAAFIVWGTILMLIVLVVFILVGLILL